MAGAAAQLVAKAAKLGGYLQLVAHRGPPCWKSLLIRYPAAAANSNNLADNTWDSATSLPGASRAFRSPLTPGTESTERALPESITTEYYDIELSPEGA